ncbi:hypothetical protein H2200_007297 [Cladophialophora chaetospira]|uniref:M protein, serotype 2.1 n=1 Tax=Cladophialophora chaetospira TaxID=386627 RepID=A0AA39CHC2_9EURO|nr:hypothetical protein H2200_007297 [Cladophialophora chaetospira]
MTTPNSRPPFSGTTPRRVPNENSPNRPVASGVPASTGSGLARTPSLRQTRPPRKPTSRTSSSFADPDLDEEESKSQNAELIQKLQERAERAERAEQHYKQELQGIQHDLDKARQEQTDAEEKDFQRQTQLNKFQADINDLKRQNRELEKHRSEDEQLLYQEQQKHMDQLAQQQTTINRLNEALRLNGIERYNASRSGNMTNEVEDSGENAGAAGLAASAGPVQHGHAPSLARALQEKEDLISSLQIDLAEAQLKMAQQDHLQDGRRFDLENKVSEYQRLNAKLKEDNDHYEQLLYDKTLKGQFMRHDRNQRESHGMTSLAEELESTDDGDEENTEGESDRYKKLESENKALRAQVDALRLYVDKIIGRLLSHEGFEHIIQDRDEPPPPPAKSQTEKALPAIPDQQTPAAVSSIAGAATGLLQRARSVVQRPGGRARPMSYAQPAAPAPSANENPATAPSIPLNRGHRRARSDQAQNDAAAAAVVQQMTRGSPMRTISGGPLSPSLRPLSPPLAQGQNPGFSQSASSAVQTPSASGNRGSSSANSFISDSHSEEQKSNTDGSSIAPQVGGERRDQSNIPGAVMKQNQLRPLRLVQEQTAEDEAAAKKANRGSIFGGWFNRGTPTTETHDE